MHRRIQIYERSKIGVQSTRTQFIYSSFLAKEQIVMVARYAIKSLVRRLFVTSPSGNRYTSLNLNKLDTNYLDATHLYT